VRIAAAGIDVSARWACATEERIRPCDGEECHSLQFRRENFLRESIALKPAGLMSVKNDGLADRKHPRAS